MRYTPLCHLILLSALTLHAERTIHVDGAARAPGDGSAEHPFATLTAARDAIRARGTSDASQEPVTVLIAPGDYRFTAPFELNEADSGTSDAPITYRAAQPLKTRFIGGISLSPSAFKPLTETGTPIEPDVLPHIRVCDLSALHPDPFPPFPNSYQGRPVPPWLYVDGESMTLARWPNADAPNQGWATFTQAIDNGLPKPDAEDPALRKIHPGSFVFATNRHWDIGAGVWLRGYWTHDWSDQVIRIASFDAEKGIIALSAPHVFGINAGTWGAKERRFYALNTLRELDAPGEWFLDRKQNRLYLYPPREAPGEIVLATLNEPLLRMRKTRHVTFTGIDFAYSHADMIRLEQTEKVEIAGCRIRNTAGGGISVNGSGNIVRSCDLSIIGTTGIYLSGGDRQRLIPAHNLAENNHIHHYGLFQRTYAPGVGANGCGQIVRNNLIHDAPHNAILYGGNEHRFERNEIFRVVMETGDAGAFYTGRDWTSQGNILRHNYIHHLGGGDADHVNTMGIYLDDCDCGDTLEGNVFWKAGRAIMIGGGRDNPVINNLVIDCPIALHIDSRGMTWKQWNDPNDGSWCLEKKAEQLHYRQPPWSERYPHLAAILDRSPREPLDNPVRGNVFVDITKKVCDFDGNFLKLIDKMEIADNLVMNTAGSESLAKAETVKGFRTLIGQADNPIDPGFRNRAKGDFELSDTARIYVELPAFKKIPFRSIGLYRDTYRTALPVRDKEGLVK